MLDWLIGKKTYLLAFIVAAVLVVLVFTNQLNPGLAIDILVCAAPCFAVTFRSAIQANHSQLLAALTDVAQAGADLRSHNTSALLGDAEKIAQVALPIAQSSGLSVNFTGPASEVVNAVSLLQATGPVPAPPVPVAPAVPVAPVVPVVPVAPVFPVAADAAPVQGGA